MLLGMGVAVVAISLARSFLIDCMFLVLLLHIDLEFVVQFLLLGFKRVLLSSALDLFGPEPGDSLPKDGKCNA